MIQSIETNLKGARPRTPLGRLTLLLGPNGSGKSRITQAVELALTGRVSDVAGKNPARPDLLAPLLPAGESVLTVRLGLPTGDHVVNIDTTAKNGAETPPGYSLPLAELNAALSSEDKAASYFLAASGSALTWDEIVRRVDGGEAFEAAVKGVSVVDMKPLDQLLFTQQIVTTYVNDTRRRVTTLADRIDADATGLGSEPTDADVAAARLAIEGGGQGQPLRLGGMAVTWDTVQDIRSRNVQQYNALVEAGGAMLDDDERTRLQAQAGSPQRLAAIKLLLERLQATNAHTCGLCNRGGEDLNGDYWEARIAAINKIAAQREADHARLSADTQIRTIIGQVQDIDAMVKPETVDLTAATGVINTANRWIVLRTFRKDHEAAEANLTALKALAAKIKDAVKSLVGSLAAGFSARVQRYLPKTDTFAIELDPLRFGLVRDGKLYSALSGAEWVRVTLAMAAAISEGKQTIPVIIAPDRAWDGKTLAETMRGLVRFSGQVILCSTVKPKGRVSSEWTIVELGETEAEAGEEGSGADAGEGSGAGPATNGVDPGFAVGVTLSEDFADLGSNGPAPASDPAPKKKRGRPPKVKPTEPATQAADPQPAADPAEIQADPTTEVRHILLEINANPNVLTEKHASGKTGADVRDVLSRWLGDPSTEEEKLVFVDLHCQIGNDLLKDIPQLAMI